MIDNYQQETKMNTNTHTYCPNCGGDGWSMEGGDCPACDGTGRVARKGANLVRANKILRLATERWDGESDPTDLIREEAEAYDRRVAENIANR